MAKYNSKNSYTQDQDVSKQVEAHGKPPLNSNRHIIGPVFAVNTMLGISNCPVLMKIEYSGRITIACFLTSFRYALIVASPVKVSVEH